MDTAGPGSAAPTGWAGHAAHAAGPASLTALATADPGALSGPDLVDAIVAAEKALSLLSGLQMRMMDALAEPFTAGDPMRLAARLARKNCLTRDDDPAQVQLFVPEAAACLAAAEIAAALRISPVTAGIRVRDAAVMTSTLAPTLDALEQGRLDRGKARVIAEHCQPLTGEHSSQLQQLLLPAAETLSTSELRDRAGHAVIAIDPAGAEERHHNAAARRELTVRPQPDAMASLTAFLPADGAVKIFQVSDLLATSTAGTPDDPRGIGARRVDALVDIADQLLSHGHLDIAHYLQHPLPDHTTPTRHPAATDTADNAATAATDTDTAATVAHPAAGGGGSADTAHPDESRGRCRRAGEDRAPAHPNGGDTDTAHRGGVDAKAARPGGGAIMDAGTAPPTDGSAVDADTPHCNGSRGGYGLASGDTDTEHPGGGSTVGTGTAHSGGGSTVGTGTAHSGGGSTVGTGTAHSGGGSTVGTGTAHSGGGSTVGTGTAHSGGGSTVGTDSEHPGGAALPGPTPTVGTAAAVTATDDSADPGQPAIAADRAGRALTRQGRRPHLSVTIGLNTLAGLDDLPAHLAGFGAIPACLGRGIAASAGTITALLTEPGTGLVTDAGALTYRPNQQLRDRIAALNSTCQFPSCRQPVWRCDIDHHTPFNKHHPEQGGRTDPENTGPYCRRHHLMKHHSDWRIRIDPKRFVLHFTSPTGHHYSSRKQPVLLPNLSITTAGTSTAEHLDTLTATTTLTAGNSVHCANSTARAVGNTATGTSNTDPAQPTNAGPTHGANTSPAGPADPARPAGRTGRSTVEEYLTTLLLRHHLNTRPMEYVHDPAAWTTDHTDQFTNDPDHTDSDDTDSDQDNPDHTDSHQDDPEHAAHDHTDSDDTDSDQDNPDDEPPPF